MDFVDMLNSRDDLGATWWSVTEKLSDKSRTAKQSCFARPFYIIQRV